MNAPTISPTQDTLPCERSALLGIAGHGIAPGSRADFFTVAAENLADAIGRHPPRGQVFHGGRLVASRGEWLG